MDLLSGYPFWAVKNGLMGAFPRLTESHDVNVLVIGGGITGALFATHLARAGFSTCVVEKRDIAWGSTSASTAMLQYEIDAELAALAKTYGFEAASGAYIACVDAVRAVLRLARSCRGVEAFPMKSLYYASRFWHAARFANEHTLRREAGIRVALLDRAEVAERFGLDAGAALLSETAAVVDPYQLTHALLARLRRAKHGVFDKTTMVRIEPGARDVRVRFDTGAVVRCRHVVLACGYETQAYAKGSVARNRSSYAYVTEPQARPLGPLETTMVWESARPYLYLRRTADRRLVVGGEDDAIDVAARRDARVIAKARKLRARAEVLFPDLDWAPAFAWAGTFAETSDGLPYFATQAELGPRVHFAMAYGGNGITYSHIGAEMLVAKLRGKRHALAGLFGFDRAA